MSSQPGTRGSVELCPPCEQQEPHTGKGAEEFQVVTEVIRATSVGCILWGSPTRRTQVAGKEKLRSRIATVFQQNILGNLLNAVRIRRDNKDGVLHTTKLELKI